MIDINGDLAERLNMESKKKAGGIYSFPAGVAQFKNGGPVYKDGGGVRQRLANSAPNLASQSRQLRYNVQNPPGQTFVRPTPQTSPAMEPINVGPRSDYAGTRLPYNGGLAPNVVDSQMVGNMAHNLAQNYNGPYQDKVRGMFPAQTGASRPGSLAQRVIGYKDGGEVEPMLEKDEYGMIEGPGTGTSDDISAELKEKDFILTAQAAQHFGEENIMRLVMLAMQQEGMEGMDDNATVQAMVSNGEIRIPEQAVEFYGLDFWRNINNMDVNSTNKMKDGKPAYAYGDLVDDEEKKRQAATQPLQQNVLDTFAGGVKQGANLAEQGYDKLRGQGYGVVPAATIQAQRATIDPIKQGLNVAGDYASKASDYLFNVPDRPQQKTVQQPTRQPNLAARDRFNQLQNEAGQNRTPINERFQEPQGATSQRSGVNPNEPSYLYWGEDFFTNQGNPERDREIFDRQRQRLDYRDQREASVIPQETEYARGRHGVSSSTKTGGFQPQPRSLGQRSGVDPLDYARLEENKRQFDITQANRQQENQGFDEADNAAIEAARKGNPAGKAYITSKFNRNKLQLLQQLYPELFGTYE